VDYGTRNKAAGAPVTHCMRQSIILVLVACSKSTAPPEGEWVDSEPPPKPAVPMTETTLADTAEYTLALGVPTTKATMFQVTVTPKKGWKVNTEYPAKLAVAPHANCAITKPAQKRDDAVEMKKTRATWQFDLTSCAGAQQLAGDLKFAVCTDKTCAEKKETLAIALNAN
jgi:hypothetical protein